MKRFAVALVPLALVVSACAVGNPKPTTYISDTGATLNGDIHSNLVGETEFWWRYGETTDYGSETPHRTVAIADDQPHPVSQPISGLTAGTTYHHQLCVQDEEEDPPRDICSKDQTFATGVAGGRSGIAFGRYSTNQEVYAMDADGSNLVNLTSSFGPSAFNPAFSPDARWIALSCGGGSGGSKEICVMPAEGGQPLALTDSVRMSNQVPAWSPDGSKITWTSFGDGPPEIYVMDADGDNQTILTGGPASDVFSDWSPDGSRIAFISDRDGNQEVYVMNADGSEPTRITNDPSQDANPAWSPDGTKIAFSSSRDGDHEIYVMDADGSDPIPLTSNTQFDLNPDWSPDGTKIAFDSQRDGGRQQIYVMDADGDNQTRLTINPEGDVGPRFSPRPIPVE